MRRLRGNRRKSPPLKLPKMPALQLPRIAIDWGRVLGFAAAGLMAVLVYALGRNLVDLPVQELEIRGSSQRVTTLEIEAAAAPALEGSFISVDLDEIRQRVQSIEWVDKVSLKRDWPGTIIIAYTEHRAAARWGETGLLNTSGELFAEDAGHEYAELPKLEGPDGSHRRVAARYLEIREPLARSGLTLDVLSMDSRGAFTIRLVGGVAVRIGREDVEGRIDRFFAVAVPALAGDIERAEYVDMRYPSGFAVGWRAIEPTTQLARLDSGG
jgi:cell division protein FtsQ